MMPSDLQRALERVAARVPDILPMLERWVRQNSFSDNRAGVDAMADLLTEDFALPELSLERHPGEGVGDHLIWKTPAWDSRPGERRVLIGHHDTVFPPGTFEGFTVEGDIARGPGVLDMKGGLCVIHTALRSLADLGVLADMPLAVISVGDEEIGSWHSRPLIEECCRGAAAALVFEAGRARDAIITQRKGTGRVTASATGKAAHAGNHHEQGRNAIWALARFVDLAQQRTDYERGVTVNVGLFQGGTSANTVPANARCTIDFRFIRADDGRALVAGFSDDAGAVSDALGVEVEVAGGIRRAPMEASEASRALCRAYAECARASGLGGEESPLLGGGSDASTASAIGVPAIDGLGPRGSGFHTHDELIEISSLLPKTQALVRYLAMSIGT